MTQTKTKKQIQVEELTEFAQLLKANGFTVLIAAKYPFEWLHYKKGGNFGTVGSNGFYRYNFGTVHKPCTECGTGFGTDSDVDLSLEYAEKSLVDYPKWANQKQRDAVRQYKSVEDFINSTHNKWAEYYTL